MINNFFYSNNIDARVSKIAWQRADGLPMSTNIHTTNGNLKIYNIQKEDFTEYTCMVITLENKLIKKSFVLKQVEYFKPKVVPNDSSDISRDMKPKVRIIPIEKDIREGGRIELECESGQFNNIP